tara:strand:+ start:153 stop:413 length:261 start_codon:yes stop_codon:yes gene_type:complete
MIIEVNDDQLKIIERALSDAIEKYVGVSQAQIFYVNNIDNGMSTKEALKQFELDNRKEWEYLVYEEKNQIYCLYDKLFESPVSYRG